MQTQSLTIATRKSLLALWQAEHVQQRLIENFPQLAVTLLKMTTKGDRILDVPLAKIGGKGLFVKELEQALLSETADLAVHSMKDVTVEMPEGLTLPVILKRENPHDAFVSNRFNAMDDLPSGAVVGTSSLRRQCQLKAWRPDLQIRSLRGNVNTRLQKLDDGDFDAIVLACAGLKRLGLAQRITEEISSARCLPAIGQGAVGIQCRTNDAEVNRLIASLNDKKTSICVRSERALNARLEGGCQVPLAGFATLQGSQLTLQARMAYPDGSHGLDVCQQGSADQPEALGKSVAEALLSQGAAKILQACVAP